MAVSGNKKSDLRSQFETEALPFMDALYGRAYALTRQVDEASDLVQETYLRAYRNFSSFKKGTNCKAWLFKILYSIFVNRYRKKQREPQQVSFDQSEERFHETLASVEAEEPGAWDWQSSDVAEALEKLPREFRDAVISVDVDGFTYEEAADILACPVGTVRSRLFRARKALFIELSEYARKKGIVKETI